MANVKAGAPPLHQNRKWLFRLRITFWSSWAAFMAEDALCDLETSS